MLKKQQEQLYKSRNISGIQIYKMNNATARWPVFETIHAASAFFSQWMKKADYCSFNSSVGIVINNDATFYEAVENFMIGYCSERHVDELYLLLSPEHAHRILGHSKLWHFHKNVDRFRTRRMIFLVLITDFI